MGKYHLHYFARYLPIVLFFNLLNLPVKSSSDLAAWALKSNGVLELRTKSNSELKAYFHKANKVNLSLIHI